MQVEGGMPGYFQSSALEQGTAEKGLCDELVTHPGVHLAFAHMQLRQAPAQPPNDPARDKVVKGKKKKERFIFIYFSSTFYIPTVKASLCTTAPVSETEKVHHLPGRAVLSF